MSPCSAYCWWILVPELLSTLNVVCHIQRCSKQPQLNVSCLTGKQLYCSKGIYLPDCAITSNVYCVFSFSSLITCSEKMDTKKLHFFQISKKIHLSFTVSQDLYLTPTWRFQDVTWKQCSYTALTWIFIALIFKNRIMMLARSSRGLHQRKGQKRWNQFVEWNCMHLQNKVIIYIRVITPPGKTSASSEHCFFPPSLARCIKSCSNRSLLFKWWW